MNGRNASRRDFLKAAAGTLGVGVGATTGLGAGIKAATAVAAVRTAAIEPKGVLWGLNYSPHIAAYHKMVDLFKAKYGSTITIQPQPGGYTALIAAIAAGTQPDLQVQNANVLAAVALQGAITTLNDSVYAANHIDIARDFVGDSVAAFSVGKNIWGVPLETDGGLGGLVNVPVDLVKKAGLEKMYPPTNGRIGFDSYDQLYSLAKALQTTVNGKVKRWGLSGEGWDFPTIGGEMLTMGTPVFDEAKEQFNFNTPVGIRAMQYHVEIPVKMGIEKEWNNPSAVIDEAINGNVAVTMGNATPVFFGAQYGYNFAGAAMPKIDGKTPKVIGLGNGWGVIGPVKPAHPKLQVAFLRLMATRDGQYAYDAGLGNVVPAWKDILLHDTSHYKVFQQMHVPDTILHVAEANWWKANLMNCRFIGAAGYLNRITDAVAAGCQSVRLGKMNSAQAMAQIQQTCEAQYRQYKIDLANLQ
jgi:maltose-binding protein MalE